MSREFWLGVGTVFASVAALALIWVTAVAGPTLVERFAHRVGCGHWSLAGPSFSKTRPPAEIFRRVNFGSRHLTSFRRLLAVGPWTLYLGRYAPGNVDEDQP